MYAVVEGSFYISTTLASRKARNLLANARVFICVPVRRMPFGPPPSTIQFASTATILSQQDPEIADLGATGSIKAVTSHGEREMAGGCFLKIEPPHTYLTYGLGMSLRQLARDPLNAGGRLTVHQISGDTYDLRHAVDGLVLPQ
jgi:hypothetical protein